MLYSIGVDVGTTGVKSLMVRQDGEVIGSDTQSYFFSSPRPNWAEQDPREWADATIRSLRSLVEKSGVSPHEIVAIGLTGQMHGSVFLDAENNPIRPAILWCDQRTYKECEEIEARVGKERLLEEIGNPALTGFTLPKLLWLRKNEPENYAKLRKLLLPKDYVRFVLCDAHATDVADASGTMMLDVKNRKWSEFMLREFNLHPDILPPVYESPEVTGYLSERAAHKCGLRSGTPVVAGAGDQAAGGVGNGIVEEGLVSITIGTSGVVFAATGKPVVETQGRLHTFCHAVPGMWHMMGVTLSAAGSMKWFAEKLWSEGEEELAPDLYEEINKSAEKVGPGSDGLIFLPYLTGERTPYPDPDARGVFFGLSYIHGRGHLARAVMEGVAYSLKDCLELMREARIPIARAFVSGGGAKSKLWLQILASVLDLELVSLKTTEGPAFGAAVLGFVGVGKFGSVQEAVREMVQESDVTAPNAQDTAVYKRLYPIYRDLYPVLRPLFGRVSALDAFSK